MSANETKVDVLPGEARINLTEYSTGIATTIAYAVMHSRPGIYWIVSDEARDAVAELIEAATNASATLCHAYHTTLTGQLADHAHEGYQRLDAALARIGGAK